MLRCSNHLGDYERRPQHRGATECPVNDVTPFCMFLHPEHFSKWMRLSVMQGTLRGYDQATNLILDDSVERVYSTKASSAMGVRTLQC